MGTYCPEALEPRAPLVFGFSNHWRHVHREADLVSFELMVEFRIKRSETQAKGSKYFPVSYRRRDNNTPAF